MFTSEYVSFGCNTKEFIHGIRDCILKVLVCYIRAGVISFVNLICKSSGESGMFVFERKKALLIIRITQVKILAAYITVRKTNHEVHKFYFVLF